MPAIYYPATINRNASGFGATFPDFPGCKAVGATMHEAALKAESALAVHVESMVDDKNDLPEPSTLDDVEAMTDRAGDVVCILARVDIQIKVEQVLISLDAGLLRAIDAVAANRSAWFAETSRAELARLSSAMPENILTYKRIEELVRKRPGLSESEIAHELFGSKGYQQMVNPDCRWLVQSGRLVRSATRPARYYLFGSEPKDLALRGAASRRQVKSIARRS